MDDIPKNLRRAEIADLLLGYLPLLFDELKRVLPQHSNRLSPKKFTLPQLTAIVIIKHRTDLSYRQLIKVLKGSEFLRSRVELRWVPHFSALSKFEAAKPDVMRQGWETDRQLLERLAAIGSQTP